MKLESLLHHHISLFYLTSLLETNAPLFFHSSLQKVKISQNMSYKDKFGSMYLPTFFKKHYT